MEKNSLKKIDVWKLILFSVITLGIYTIVWAYKRMNELNRLELDDGSRKEIFYGFALIWLAGLAIYVLLLLGKFPTDVNTLKILGASSLVIAYVLLVMLCFDFKKLLDTKLRHEGSTIKLSGFFSVVFSAFYIQYEINRMLKGNEYQKRKGPIAFAIVILGVILPVTLIIILLNAFTDIRIF